MRGAGIVGIGGVGGRATWEVHQAGQGFSSEPGQAGVSPVSVRTSCGSPTPPGGTPARGGAPTREGKEYCAAVLDTYSRRIVDSSIASLAVSRVGDERPGRAIDSRARPGAETGTIIYSDHGAQFASWAFTKQVEDAGLLPLRLDRCISRAWAHLFVSGGSALSCQKGSGDMGGRISTRAET